MSKTFKIFKKAFIGIILFLIVAVLGVIIYFRAPVHSYYKISKKGFVIPDSNKNYIAQGISYDSASDNFYLTGYMKNGSASPIYIVNKKNQKKIFSLKKFLVLNYTT